MTKNGSEIIQIFGENNQFTTFEVRTNSTLSYDADKPSKDDVNESSQMTTDEKKREERKKKAKETSIKCK